MNLILFTAEEIGQPLPRHDPRAQHLLHTLRRQPGDRFDAGVINGPRATAIIRHLTGDTLELDFITGEEPHPLHPVVLLAGLSRPQTMRKILQEATSLGVSALHFFATEKGETSYAESKLWSTGEDRRHLIAGAEQAFTTLLPSLHHHSSLAAALDALSSDTSLAALDNYEATRPLSDYRPARLPCGLAVGSERGWAASERALFRERNIPLLHLGPRVLRTETAALCSIAILLANCRLH